MAGQGRQRQKSDGKGAIKDRPLWRTIITDILKRHVSSIVRTKPINSTGNVEYFTAFYL